MNDALEKFKELPHIDTDCGSIYRVVNDWGYSPNLYHYDGSWHVSWIHCQEGDTLKDFSGSTPEEVIDLAYEWFHGAFSNNV
jgi:hypothetical protein